MDCLSWPIGGTIRERVNPPGLLIALAAVAVPLSKRLPVVSGCHDIELLILARSSFRQVKNGDAFLVGGLAGFPPNPVVTMTSFPELYLGPGNGSAVQDAAE